MNGEKPKFRPWADVVKEQKETIKLIKQQLSISEAILAEAETHIKEKDIVTS